ncbi:gluconolaconase [Streptomyces yaizuensis]|uniref:SMP-30/gluconolactonase/LRE family protein n=1 Tax=Streptomyces yaizuensis TaxID=2989713 RepID=A0ABQ5NZM7_9ACTN|nr:gluconolaconase [Streptomyces sp. YSPA8]GLF95618.1 SMP-30/gluconolactonase/LRE family protein [Streptomyces sp. YSPA8]
MYSSDQATRRTLLRLAAAGAAGGALAAVPSPALARTGAVSGSSRSTDRCRLPRTLSVLAPNLYPEGVAWDRGRRAFLVSSSVQGTISVVRADGSITPLVTPFAQVSVLGLHADARRGQVVAAYSDFFHRRLGLVDVTKPPVNGVGVFDLRSGAVLRTVPVSTGAPIEPRVNDVTVDGHGDIYVTDTEVDTVTRVGRDGEVLGVIRDERFVTAETGPNGIVHHPGGFLLVGRYSGGRLFRVDRPRSARPQVSEVRLDRAPDSIDGLALRPDGSVLVVSNGLSTAGRDAVLVLRSTDGWRSARTASDHSWPIQDPTTAAVTPYGDYVISGGLREILTGVPSPTPGRFHLRRR